MKASCLILILMLTGCSTYSEQFDCPYGKGLGCASLSKVNKLLDEQQIDLNEEPGKAAPKKRQVHVYYGPDQMSKLITISDAVDL
ncbi:hypothetical protein [Candidatus Odyssella thessalonicensis]|uniref:hypothetical protein n=1 Tax=Candidatus Odyssella thessalonicensis TaxID=84647 RepID=UPI000225B968|nr:hypothetical protein [Candidatus Odyssella thessalonicensis]